MLEALIVWMNCFGWNCGFITYVLDTMVLIFLVFDMLVRKKNMLKSTPETVSAPCLMAYIVLIVDMVIMSKDK